MADLRLVYFKMRALAEAPQLLLHYTGTPYSYEMAWDYFGQPWSEVKASVPTGSCQCLLSMTTQEFAKVVRSPDISRS